MLTIQVPLGVVHDLYNINDITAHVPHDRALAMAMCLPHSPTLQGTCHAFGLLLAGLVYAHCSQTVFRPFKIHRMGTM